MRMGGESGMGQVRQGPTGTNPGHTRSHLAPVRHLRTGKEGDAGASHGAAATVAHSPLKPKQQPQQQQGGAGAGPGAGVGTAALAADLQHCSEGFRQRLLQDTLMATAVKVRARTGGGGGGWGWDSR